MRLIVGDLRNFTWQFPDVRRRWLIAILTAGCILFPANSTTAQQVAHASAPADTQLTLHVRDGRLLTGHINQRTDDEVVWLRVSRGGVFLSTGLTWDLIQEVQVGEKRYSAADFRAMGPAFASPSPKSSTISAPNKTTPSRPVSNLAQRPAATTFSRVQSLELEAQIANWDRDAESDGIALRVLPLAADGRVLAIDGVISVQLIGRNFVDARNTEGFPRLGQWSQRVRSADFHGASGAMYQLPIFAPLDHDPSVLSIGMVHVQLNAFGQGDFEAVTPTRLRNYNPIRDQLDEHHLRYDSFGRYRARHW